MQLPTFTYQAPGFMITTADIFPLTGEQADTQKEVLGIHIGGATNLNSFFLSTAPIEKSDVLLHIYFTNDHVKWPALIFPFLNNEIKREIIEKIHPCSPGMISAITSLLECNLLPEPAVFFYEAKALELLILAIHPVHQDNVRHTSPKLSAVEIQMLENARDILVSDFENIPTIKQLARKVGTNDFKLKQRFKLHFGSSIFAYVQGVRLEKARKLLIETDQSITDIAYSTGYDHSNNFTVAFKRNFGVGPKYFRDMRHNIFLSNQLC